MSISIIINLKVDLILIFSFKLLLYFKGATALLVLFIISLEMFIFSLWGLTPRVFLSSQKRMAAAHASKAFSINTGFISCLFFSLQKTGTHVNDGRNTFILTVNMSGSLAI